MASYRTSTTTPADIVTYRLGETLVYVKPTTDYEEAVGIAQKEFPESLSQISRHRITFTIQATMNGSRRTVRISESAWAFTVTRMLRGEVVTIEVLPEEREKSLLRSEAPPKYLEVPQADTVDFRKSRSTPPSRASSPSGRNISPARSEKNCGKTWFKRFC